jgi:hypothetical protein
MSTMTNIRLTCWHRLLCPNVWLPAIARDAYLASEGPTAAHGAKRQCINTCRARYRDCRRLNQLPSFECRSVHRRGMTGATNRSSLDRHHSRSDSGKTAA